VSKFEGWKERNFCGRTRATLSLAKPLNTIVQTTCQSMPVSRLTAKKC